MILNQTMQTKLGTITLNPNDSGDELTIILKSNEPINLSTAIEFLGILVNEMGIQVEKLKSEVERVDHFH